jgi:sugar phosphate isomerase/epimerase
MKRVLSLAQLTVSTAGPLELIDVAADAGFDAIGLRIRASGLPMAEPICGNEPLQRRIAERLRERRVSVLAAMSARIGPQGVLGGDVEPMLEAAHAVGARFLVATAWDEDASRLADRLAALHAQALGYGIEVALEFAAYTAVRDAGAAWALSRASGSRLVLDVLHFCRSGGTPPQLAQLDLACVAYVQVCDAARAAPADLAAESSADRLDPGEGQLPLGDVLARIPPGTPLEHEAPCRALEGMPHAQRARRAYAALSAVST